MIVDVHAISGTKDAEDVRHFLADTLNYPFVDADEWLILALSPSELGISSTKENDPHEFYLLCDDLEASAKDLRGKGVEFTRTISETSLGYIASIKLPGGGEIGLCQQKDQSAPQPSA